MWGKSEIIYISLHCHHQNDSCVKVGSDESHFNVSVGSDGQSHKTVSTDHNFNSVQARRIKYSTSTGGKNRSEFCVVFRGIMLSCEMRSAPACK